MKTNSKAVRAQHHAALAALYASTTGTPYTGKPITLWRALKRIEHDASNAATAQCNGSAYGGQPYRSDYDEDASPTEYEVFCDTIRARVAKVFGGKLPAGFRFNQDPRGYALKIDGPTPEGLVTDWGGYGILAPVID